VNLSRRTLLASLCAAPRLWGSPPGDSPGPLTLPARRNDFHQLLVPARIAQSPPQWCELDSGGGGPLVFIDAAKAAAIGIQPTFYGRSAGPVEGALAPDWRARVTLAFPGLQLAAQELVIKPGPLPGDKDASIGMLVLNRFVVELDQQSPAVRLHEPGHRLRILPPKNLRHALRRRLAFRRAKNRPAVLDQRERRRAAPMRPVQG